MSGVMNTVPWNGGSPVWSSAKSTARFWSIVTATDAATWCAPAAVTVTSPDTFANL